MTPTSSYDIKQRLGVGREGVQRWRRRLMLLAGLLIVMVVLGGVTRSQNRGPDIQYQTATVSTGSLTVKVTATGSLQSVTEVKVGTEISRNPRKGLRGLQHRSQSRTATRVDQYRQATITVASVTDVPLVPNMALRFTPPQTPESSGGFLSSLIPRPPTAQQPNPTNTDKQHQRVWIVQNQQLTPVEISVGMSDGRSTQIVTGNIKAGMSVVTDVISQRK
jgi:multidrug efflux pump subunit AcrA (membrane-fusion protein)